LIVFVLITTPENSDWNISFKLPLRDEHGNIVKWFGSSVDIEDRKCAEQRFAEKTTELERSAFYLPEGNDEGESIEDLSKQGPASAGAAQVRPDDNGFLWIDRGGFAQAFAAGVDPVEARVMAVVEKPLSVASFTGKPGPPAWKNPPLWYMVGTNDQMIPPQAEEFMAKRMGATVVKVPASHASLVSHPKEVVDLIIAAAESAGK
jgi:pimeloyl-ACP methyl ester carboxylesterase